MIITAGTVTSAKSAVSSVLTSAEAAAHSAAVDAAGQAPAPAAGNSRQTAHSAGSSALPDVCRG